MKQWTIRQVWMCLIGSSCLTLALSVSGYTIWSRSIEKRLVDPKNKIVSIVQTGSEKEALKTVYLAELLALSTDVYTSLYALSCTEAERRLLSSPLISSAVVKRIPPGTLCIDYEARKPIAWLSDYQTTGIDKEGYMFPMAPFFSPKELPEIYLGLPSFGAPEDRFGRKGGGWQTPIRTSYFQLALDVLQFLETAPWKEGFRLKKIDVSNAFAPSLGQREVVLFTEEDFRVNGDLREVYCIFPKILRLAPKDYPQQLNHFFLLRRNMAEDYKKQLLKISESARFQPRIIDLRIPQLAFVENHP
jgi:hypothetical protein